MAPDFSSIIFPVWPNFNIAMPKDYGYTQNPDGDSATTALAVYVPPIDAGILGGDRQGGSPPVDTLQAFTS